MKKYEVEYESVKFYVYDDSEGVSILAVDNASAGSMWLGMIFDKLEATFSVQHIAVEILKGKAVA